MTTQIKSREQRLRACEKVLEEHMEEFYRVGVALTEIKNDKLYKVKPVLDGDGFYTDFDKYCRDHWELSRTHADRLIYAAYIRKKIPPSGGSFQWTERTIRPITKLEHSGKVEAIAKEAEKLARDNKKGLTSTVVNKAIEIITRKKKPKPKPKKKKQPEFYDMLVKWQAQLENISDKLNEIPEDAIQLLSRDKKSFCKDLAETIEKTTKSLERFWRLLP